MSVLAEIREIQLELEELRAKEAEHQAALEHERAERSKAEIQVKDLRAKCAVLEKAHKGLSPFDEEWLAKHGITFVIRRRLSGGTVAKLMDGKRVIFKESKEEGSGRSLLREGIERGRKSLGD